MINGECWLNDSVKADLTVIPLEGWRRSMKWAHTGLQWPRPSPNIPTDTTAEVYPGLCLLEATNVSEGRGTNRPFQTVGAPFVNGEALASSLDSLRLPGVTFRPVDFIPASSKYKGELCHGVFIDVTSADSLKPTTMGLSIVSQLWKLYRENLVFSERGFRRLAGVGGLVQDIKGGVPPRQMEERWKGSVDEFRILASRYRLYANE